MELYTNGPAVHEVKSETKGGEVESSPMSFYLSPIKAHINNDTFVTAEGTESDEKILLVFGVKIQAGGKEDRNDVQTRLPRLI
jgi:hypothetical protein